MGTLYVVPTPIGNLEDITLRALRTLKEADLIAAEDTRVTRKLLARYEIGAPLTSFHAHSGRGKLEELAERLRDCDIALVSDAGTPTINDPGQELIAAAADMGFEVVALPGASAVTTALAASGIRADGFVYVGFLPRRQAERLGLLRGLATESRALVAFESPHRVERALKDIREALGDRRIAVCREMTKMHEEIFRGLVSEAIEYFAAPRGEFTLVMEGAGSGRETTAADTAELLKRMKERGASARDAVKMASEASGRSRRELYAEWLSLDR